MAEVRRAEATWTGDLVSGSGIVTAATSGKFRDLGVTWADRTQESSGKTSPEELLAASHAACFSMAFSARLAKNGTPPNQHDIMTGSNAMGMLLLDDTATTCRDWTTNALTPGPQVGHTDGMGTDAYNQALSLRRARAGRAYQVEGGIPARRIEVEG